MRGFPRRIALSLVFFAVPFFVVPLLEDAGPDEVVRPRIVVGERLATKGRGRRFRLQVSRGFLR